MGQQIVKPERRRLALAHSSKRLDNLFEVRRKEKYGDFGDVTKEGMVIRLFGLHDYGYDKDRVVFSSWLTFILETWASFSINVLESAAILGITVYLQEHPEWWPESRRNTTGISYIYNVQAGYVWYHYFVKGHRDWATFLATWAAVASDLGAVLGEAGLTPFEKSDTDQMVSHFHHYIGASEGMTAAFFFDWLRPRRGKPRTLLLLLVPFITIGFMVLAGLWGDKQAAKMRSSEDRLSFSEER